MNAIKNSAGGEIEHLTTATCWHLLEQSSLGRLAVVGADGIPDVFPVNFAVHDGRVYLRSAPGSKLLDVAARSGVAFEIDGSDGVSRWSVVLKGAAQRVDEDAEILGGGIEELPTASPTTKNDVIAITPTSVTGRRFRKQSAAATRIRRPAPVLPTTGTHETIRPPEDDGPIPIPHYPPLT